MEDKTAEATDSLSKQAGGIVGLDGPLDSLDLTNILAKEFEEQEQGSEEPSPSGGVVEEAEPVGEIEPTEEPAEEATNTEHDLSQDESETESEPVAEPGEEPEWMQRRIDRFTQYLAANSVLLERLPPLISNSSFSFRISSAAFQWSGS
jgi:hypothetical protein